MKQKDYEAFRYLLKTRAREFFLPQSERGQASAECFIARAPGRIDVMGGVGDYSGSVVLEGTLAEAAFAAVHPRTDGQLRLWSYGIEKEGFEPRFETSLDSFYHSGGLISYEEAKKLFTSDPAKRWVAYIGGAFYVLLAEGVVDRLPGGADVFVHSSVPIGAGVSSSAAIEVAAMYAATAAYGIKLEGLQLARLCQIVENRVAGAPCGIMDQVTSALGRQDELLALLCQPHELLGFHSFPEECYVFAIDSGVKHSVAGTKYTRARTAAFMGLAILMKETGQDFGGYLCNITPQEYWRSYRRFLPAKMKGEEFIKRYGQTPDTVTQVQPDETYSVRACVEHAIYENARVRRFIEVLNAVKRTDNISMLEEAGDLMYASHWSYKYKLALGARETDLLVRLAQKYFLGANGRLFGAKITGGGSGGAVAVLAIGEISDILKDILHDYYIETGINARVFQGSSPGALQFGVRKMTLR